VPRYHLAVPVERFDVDVLIFGGGIAGLWILARLRAAGYSCLLLEKHTLGAGQTIASQGIIHGGVKYALTGAASRASRAIAEMPGIWRACLAGDGEIDLQGSVVLSEHQYLWTTGGLGSRLMGLAATHAIRTAVERVPEAQRPPALASAPRRVDVYRVAEPVLCPRSVVSRLAEQLAPWIIVEDGAGFARFTREATGQVRSAIVEVAGAGELEIGARTFIFAAGEGNALLLEEVGGEDSDAPIAGMQRRPLHMVMARGRTLPPLYGHCVGLSDKPRITVTSQQDAAAGEGGRTVWYIGGQIAETGISRDREDQIAAAKRELGACLPWLPDAARAWEDTQWATLRIDRAEGLTPGGERPDEPVIAAQSNVIVAWPTKLGFAPAAAARVLSLVRERGGPSGRASAEPARLIGRNGPPPVAPLPWEEVTLLWS
jgi:glycerol-3-phosphate dehydrogenase